MGQFYVLVVLLVVCLVVVVRKLILIEWVISFFHFAHSMRQAKQAKAHAEKHMSFREKSIKKREDKKKAARELEGGMFGMLKKFFVGLILCLVVVAVLAILGCEMEVDGLKESFVCMIGKPPPEDRRRLTIVKLMRGVGWGRGERRRGEAEERKGYLRGSEVVSVVKSKG